MRQNLMLPLIAFSFENLSQGFIKQNRDDLLNLEAFTSQENGYGPEGKVYANMSKLDRQLNVNEILFVTENVAKYVYCLARHLKLSDIEIERIECSDYFTHADRVSDVIKFWVRRYGRKATVGKMVHALQFAKMPLVAGKLENGQLGCHDVKRKLSGQKPGSYNLKRKRAKVQKAPSFEIRRPEYQELSDAVDDKSITLLNLIGCSGSGKSFLLSSISRKERERYEVCMLADYTFKDIQQLTRDIVDKIPFKKYHLVPKKLLNEDHRFIESIKEIIDKKSLLLIVDFNSYFLTSNGNDRKFIQLLHNIIKENYLKKFKLIISSNTTLFGNSIVEYADCIKEVYLHDFDTIMCEKYLTNNLSYALPPDCIKLLCDKIGTRPRTLRLVSKLDIYSTLKLPRGAVSTSKFAHNLHIHGNELIFSLASNVELMNDIQNVLTKTPRHLLNGLIQTLVFSDVFIAKEVESITGNSQINESLLQKLPLLIPLKDRCIRDKVIVRKFKHDPILREALINNIEEKEDLNFLYEKTSEQFCKFMTSFLDFLSQCYFRSKQKCNEKSKYEMFQSLFLQVLQPEKECEINTAKWAVAHFNHHKKNIEEAIIQGCQLPGMAEEMIGRITKPKCYHLLGKLLLFPNHCRIYGAIDAYNNKLCRFSKYSVLRANCKKAMAYFLINLHGYKRYCYKAHRLLQASASLYPKDKRTTSSLDYADCLSKLGRCVALRAIKDNNEPEFENAIAMITDACIALRQLGGETNIGKILASWNDYHISGLYFIRKDYIRSTSKLKESMGCLNELISQAHPIYLSAKQRRADIQRDMYSKRSNEFENAIHLFKDVHDEKFELFGDHPEIIRVLLSKAEWYDKKENIGKKKKALIMAEKMFNRLKYDMPDIADVFSKLSLLYDEKKRIRYIDLANQHQENFIDNDAMINFGFERTLLKSGSFRCRNSRKKCVLLLGVLIGLIALLLAIYFK